MDDILYDLGKIKGSIRRNKDIINDLNEQLKNQIMRKSSRKFPHALTFK